MSTTLFYTVQRKIGGKYETIDSSSNFDKAILEDGILKIAFSDDGEFSKALDINPKIKITEDPDVTLDVFLEFSNKYPNYENRNNEIFNEAYEKAKKSPSYPYNKPKVLVKSKKSLDQILSSWGRDRDVAFELSIEKVNKNLKVFLDYIEFKIDCLKGNPIQEIDNLKSEIIKSGDITKWIDKIYNIIENSNGNYMIVLDGSGRIKELKEAKRMSQLSEFFSSSDLYQISYINEKKEILQSKLLPAKISFPADISKMIRNFENEIAEMEATRTAENRAKNYISSFMDDIPENEKSTELARRLKEFCKTDSFLIWEQNDIDKMKEVVTQLNVLKALMGPEGRFVYYIG